MGTPEKWSLLLEYSQTMSFILLETVVVTDEAGTMIDNGQLTDGRSATPAMRPLSDRARLSATNLVDESDSVQI